MRRWFKRGPVVMVGALMAMLLGSIQPAAAQTWTTYDAGLGTLPAAQSFGTASNGIAPAPTLTGGLFHQNTTGNQEAVQAWFSSPAQHGRSWDFTNGFTLEADLQVVSSGYVADIGGNQRRAGYTLAAADNTGRLFRIDFTSTGLWLSNNDSGNPSFGTPLTALDTSVMRNYRLVTQGGTGTLFVDGAAFLSVPMGTPSVSDRSTGYFGENTSFAGSETKLRQFRFTTEAVPPVPEPASFVLILPGLAACGLLRKRRKAA